MGFGQDLQRFASRTLWRAEIFANAVEDEAIKELARRLEKVLPGETPVDSGALSRSYTFRFEGDQLIVGSTAFYAHPVRRYGHDLPKLVVDEAEKIINDPLFRAVVRDRALARV